MRYIIILWHILLLPSLGYSQICGLRDTMAILPESTQTLPIEVMAGDLVNDDLSDPGQGLCGIEIEFFHEYGTEINFTLVSPAGQSIQLTGPTALSFSPPPTFSVWRVTFVPGAETALPDPGFTARWNNNLNINSFVFGSSYRGSYYPYSGNLEDFNTGTVSGTWNLIINNEASIADGNFYSIRLIFCDQTGLDCCFADAGMLDEVDLLVCEGNDALMYTPTVNYPLEAPDDELYGYTYLLSQDSILLEYDSTGVDLNGFSAGTYQVCGLSYLRADSLLLPQPDGQFTIGAMFTDLNSLSPSFCGELTGDCQEIVIEAPPEPVDTTVSFCEGTFYTFLDTTYTEAGSHPYILKTASGCDSVINVLLSMIPIRMHNIDTTVCAGEVVQVGSSTYDRTGIYRDTLLSSLGCDSIIVLDLEVVGDITTTVNEVICQGDSLVIGNQTFFTSDNYRITLPSSRNCDSIVNLNLTVLNPFINLAPVDTVTCAEPTIVLDASGSTPTGLLDFEWQDDAGNTLGVGSTLPVDQPGEYFLLLTQEAFGTGCTVQQIVPVTSNESFPVADAGPGQTLSCTVPDLRIGGSNTSLGSDFAYEWTTDTGNFLDPTDIPDPRVDAPGQYQLVVTNTTSSCSDTSVVIISLDQDVPVVNSLPDTSLTCDQPTILLTSAGSSQGASFTYAWRDDNGNTLGTDQSLEVDRSGTFRLVILNSASGCRDSTQIIVTADTLSPEFSIASPEPINCEQPAIRLNALAPGLDPDVTINWEATNSGMISEDANSLTPLVTSAGSYILTLSNTRNGCETQSSIDVQDNRNDQRALPSPPDIISCNVSSVSLDIGNSTGGPNVLYRWTTNDGQFAGSATGATVLVNAAGTYTLTVIDTVSRCSDMASVVVQRDTDTPVAEAGNGFTMNCQVQRDTLFGNGSTQGDGITYQWRGPCLQSNPDSLWVIVDCPGMYFLEVTDTGNNCSVVDSVEVVLDIDPPLATVLAADTLSCRTPVVTLDASSSDPSGALQFSWTGPDITGMTSDPLVQVAMPGTYQLIVLNTNNFCYDTTSVEIVENVQDPIADAGPELTLTCTDPQGQIGSSNTSAGAFYIYEWTAIEGQLPGPVDLPIVPVDREGIYRLVVTDSRNGCEAVSTVVVVEDKEFPGADAGPDQEINCGSDLVTLDGSFSVKGPEIDYLWTGPCLVGRTDSIGARSNCPGEYLLTVTNTTTGCSTTDTVIIQLNPAAPLAVLPDTAFVDCADGSAVLDGSASSDGFFEWTREGAVVASGQNRITVTESGSYHLSVANQDGSCVATDSIMVVGYCQPEAIITQPDRITCQQSTAVLAAGNSQGQSLDYQWIAPDTTCIVGGQGTPNLEVSCGGVYTLILTNTFVMLSDTQTVTVDMDDNLPVAVVGPPDTLNCLQNEVILDGSGSTAGTNIRYRWTRVSNDALVAETPTTTVQAPGTYRLEVVDTSSLCASTATVRIVEFNLPIRLTFGDSVLACGQDTFPLTVFPTPLSDFYRYEWSGPEIVDQSAEATVLIGEKGSYTVTVTDQRSECQAIASVSLTEDQQCAPCITIAEPDTLTCARPNLQLNAAYCRICTGCGLQWTTPDGNIVADGNTLQPTVDRAGTYRLTVVDLQGFQTEIETEVVADNSLPQATAGPDRILTCDSTAVSLGNPALPPPQHVIYTWTALSDPGNPLVIGPVVRVSEPGIYVQQAIDTLTSCISSDTVSVSLDTSIPVAEAGPDRTLTCADIFVIINSSGSSSGSEFSYSWTSTNPDNCIQGKSSANPILTCPGTYILEIENINTGCSAQDSMQVNASDGIPFLPPLPDTAFVCGVDSIELNPGLPNPANFTFQWCTLEENGQPVLGSCVSDLFITVYEAGRYQLTATDNSTGCAAALIVAVNDLRNLPLVEAGPDLMFRCTDDSLTINATSEIDPTQLNIQWSSRGNLPIGNNGTLNPIVYGPDTLVLTATDQQTGCTVIDTVVLTQDINAPTVEAGPDTALTCRQPTLQLTGKGLAANGNSVSYLWTTIDGNIQANADTPTPLINRPGTYVLTVSDAGNGCATSDAVVVSDQREPPTAAIFGLDDLEFSCEVDSLLLDASSSSAANGGSLDYLWSVVSSGNLIGDPSQMTIFADAIGTYRLIVTDRQSGCRDSMQFTLSATFGAPQISIAPVASLTCTRQEVVLDASGSEYGADYSATWFNSQGEIMLTDNLQLKVTEPGSYTLQIDNQQSGCSNLSDPVTVTVDTLVPKIQIAPPDLLDCTINTVALDASASATGPVLQYQWSTDGGILLSGETTTKAVAGGPGTYYLEIENTQNGCVAEDSVAVEAITVPIAGAEIEMIAPGCTDAAGGGISVTEVLGGTAPFAYMLNDGVELSSGIFSQLLAGTYQLTIRDANGCEWEEEVIIPVAAPIEVELGADIQIISGDSLLLEAQTSSSDIVSYRWEPPVSTGPTAVVAPEVSTSYGLTVVDVNGCTASDRVRVIVEKSRAYYVPNAFSPDGDGSNDRFTILAGSEVVNIASFRIYDRWGHLVYERTGIPPNDPDLGWDGRHNGHLLNAAVFVYFAELEYRDGWKESVKGEVVLLR